MKKATTKIVPQIEVKKAQSQRGKYVYKPLVSVVIMCKCGNKYVSTRLNQKTCITCIQAR